MGISGVQCRAIRHTDQLLTAYFDGVF